MPVSTPFIFGADPAGQPVAQALRMTNRHGLIAGATGTGKTVTLQRLAEAFSDAGVAVFAADVKGDLCGLGPLLLGNLLELSDSQQAALYQAVEKSRRGSRDKAKTGAT